MSQQQQPADPANDGQSLIGLRLVIDCALAGIGGLAVQLFVGVLIEGERGSGSGGFLFADMAGARYLLWAGIAIGAAVALGAAADIVRKVFVFIRSSRPVD